MFDDVDEAYDRWRDQDLLDNGISMGRRRWGKRPVGEGLSMEPTAAQLHADALWNRATIAMDRHDAVGGDDE